MITEDSLATAQIAQLFGSELLKVQKNATTDSGMQPNIVNLDPKQFLVGQSQMTNQRKTEEQRIIRMLQAEAEAACPLNDTQYSQSSSPLPPLQPPPAALEQVKPLLQQTIPRTTVVATGDIWEKINSNLERIANSLERVDVSVKKKRIKRTKHETNS